MRVFTTLSASSTCFSGLNCIQDTGMGMLSLHGCWLCSDSEHLHPNAVMEPFQCTACTPLWPRNGASSNPLLGSECTSWTKRSARIFRKSAGP